MNKSFSGFVKYSCLLVLFFLFVFCTSGKNNEATVSLLNSCVFSHLVGFNVESKDVVIGENSCVYSIEKKTILQKANFSFCHWISVDSIQAESLVLNLDYKIQFADSLFLEIKAFNEFEEIIEEKKIDVNRKDSTRQCISVDLDIHSTNQLYVSICGNFPTAEKSIFSLYDFNFSYSPDKIKTEKSQSNIQMKGLLNPIQLSESNFSGFGSIKGWKSAKIIGIGETMHGSKDLAQSAYQTIQYLIEKENCKLVFIEYPMLVVAYWNEYVLGTDDIDINGEFEKYKYPSSNELIIFLQWMRKYNENASRPVMIAGMDVSFDLDAQKGYLYDIFNYLLDSAELKKEIIDRLMRLDLEPFFRYILENPKWRQILLKHNLHWHLSLLLEHELKITKSIKQKSVPVIFRDSIMYENMEFLIKNYLQEGEKAVVYAHLCHTNKQDFIYPVAFKPALGNYLNKKYGKSYFSIALLAGTGEFAGIYRAHTLPYPVANSIENLCLETNLTYFYSSLPPIKKLVPIRIIPTIFNENSCFSNHFFCLTQRFDAFLFKRESTFDKNNTWFSRKTNKYFMNILVKYLDNEQKLKSKIK
jgi:erythromycin esterase-like protein